jgi:Ca2+-binding RTX toxin-like protein
VDRADDATVTLGNGNDTLSFDAGQHGANVIDADKGSDTLSMGGTLSGNVVIDLSSTTDQITTLNGVGNAAVQKGFESVDLSSVTVSSGVATITGSSTAGTLTGSSAADTITGGTAVDTITGGTGADTMTGGATGLDNFVIAAGDAVITIGGSGNAGTITGMDKIMDYSVGTASALCETLTVTGGAVGTVASNGTDTSLTVAGTAIKSATYTTGLVTFDDADNHTGIVAIDSLADIAAAIQYLQGVDLGNTGATVMFNVADDSFGADAGTVTEAVVFTQGSSAGTDNTLDTVTFLFNTGTVTDVLLTTNASTAGAIFIV